MRQSEYSPTERAALITWKMLLGAHPTTPEVAQIAGISRVGAWELMDRLSRVLPLFQERNGRRVEWRILSDSTYQNRSSRPQ